MTIEQPLVIVGFIVALALTIVVTYYRRRRQLKFPVAIATGAILPFSISTFIIRSLEGDAIGVFFLWISCILGLSLSLDMLTWRGGKLNMKLVASSWLVVTSVGGILTNLYIFSVPASLGARIFSLSVLVLVHLPILVALLAYLKGRKELSKKLVNFGYVKGGKNGV